MLYQINILYTLNLQNVTYQLYLNNERKKTKKKTKTQTKSLAHVLNGQKIIKAISKLPKQLLETVSSAPAN